MGYGEEQKLEKKAGGKKSRIPTLYCAMRSTQAEACPSACCCLASCTGVHKRRTGRESVRIFTSHNTCARILAKTVQQGMPGIDTQQMASILFLVHCKNRSQINSTTGVVMNVCRWWRV